jgi:pimeloyl-ACP methyl ester carboxylesterase
MSDELPPIELRRHGSAGSTVVVLHGGPGAADSGGLAQALSGDFAVLEPVQRRSGRVPLTVAQHVADLAEIAPRPAALVGTSWGAMLGLSYASRHPHDVLALVLVGCGTYDEASRALYRAALEQRLGDAARRARSLAELAAAHLRASSYELDEGESEPFGVDEAGHHETWQDALRLQREGIEPAAFRAITARVLMIHGDVDPHPGPATRDLLRRFVPQLEYVGLERCGHEPWRERHARDAFLDAVRKWL